MGLRSHLNARRFALVSAPLLVALTMIIGQPVQATTSCQQKNSCVLVFLSTSQPADALINTAITSEPFGAGSPVAVQVQKAGPGGVPTGTPVAVSDTIVLSAVNAPTNSASTVGLPNSSANTNGTPTATFSTLEADTAGSYRLAATDISNTRGVIGGLSTTPTSGSGSSPYFTIFDDLQPCTTCTVGNSNHETVVVSAPSANGELASSLGADNKDKFLTQNGTLSDCGASPKLKAQFGPNVTQLGGTLSGAPADTKTVTLTYDQTYVNEQSNNGASFYQVCYQPAVGDSFQDINNQTVTGPAVGLLPYPCGSTTKPFSKLTPVSALCIASKTKNTGSGTVTIILTLPLSDPRLN